MGVFGSKIDNLKINPTSDFSMFINNLLLFKVKTVMDYTRINSETLTVFQYRYATFVQ